LKKLVPVLTPILFIFLSIAATLYFSGLRLKIKCERRSERLHMPFCNIKLYKTGIIEIITPFNSVTSGPNLEKKEGKNIVYQNLEPKNYKIHIVSNDSIERVEIIPVESGKVTRKALNTFFLSNPYAVNENLFTFELKDFPELKLNKTNNSTIIESGEFLILGTERSVFLINKSNPKNKKKIEFDGKIQILKDKDKILVVEKFLPLSFLISKSKKKEDLQNKDKSYCRFYELKNESFELFDESKVNEENLLCEKSIFDTKKDKKNTTRRVNKSLNNKIFTIDLDEGKIFYKKDILKENLINFNVELGSDELHFFEDKGKFYIKEEKTENKKHRIKDYFDEERKIFRSFEIKEFEIVEYNPKTDNPNVIARSSSQILWFDIDKNREYIVFVDNNGKIFAVNIETKIPIKIPIKVDNDILSKDFSIFIAEKNSYLGVFYTKDEKVYFKKFVIFLKNENLL